eukprot:CAMPEP_0202727748 /NCGR_PEP_ID=MMETSP1385-20130828/185281_1 /ASSEMBLY_ACC=CAM_ASM_000861 /TAXON_ID=933848 /ORGANISM="Elphidium margaritaceum" /LENGTH=62 /DNA_ID=CAMNT_0049393991 /DNA_START=1102 /DNA_END=1287 /DNA_ORIENTATION=+
MTAFMQHDRDADALALYQRANALQTHADDDICSVSYIPKPRVMKLTVLCVPLAGLGLQFDKW